MIRQLRLPFPLLWAVIGLAFCSAPSVANATVRIKYGESETGQNQGVMPFTIPCCDWYWSDLAPIVR